MYAMVVTVNIAAGQLEGARKALQENVVPQARKAPGFVKGYWTAAPNGKSGTSLVIFKTKPDAENAAKMAGDSPAPPGVTVTSVEVREVVAEA
jgi:hypothetical protein